MKSIELIEVKNENGITIYYKKNNGHKLTPEQLTYNQITKGLNYIIKYTITEVKNISQVKEVHE